MRSERGIDLIRVGGVQVTIDSSWIVIALLVLWSLAAGYFPSRYPGHGIGEYWAAGAVATLLFFGSVLVHELMHAFVGNRLGHPVRRITLFLFGGMAHLAGEPRDAAAELRIAAVGPVTSLVLAGLFWLAGTWAAGVELLGAMLDYLVIVNVALAVFNLLPGFPLDGGRILRAALWLRWKDLRRATETAARWGGGIGFAIMALGVLQIFAGALVGGLWLIFIGMFLRGAAGASYQRVVVDQALGAARVRDLMVRDPVAIPADASVEQAVHDYFLRHGFGGYPVVADGGVQGLVSLRQVKQCPPEERARRRVRDVMRPADAAVCVEASASAGEALRRMAEADSGRLLVTDGGRVVGLVTRTGITRFLRIRDELAEPAAA